MKGITYGAIKEAIGVLNALAYSTESESLVELILDTIDKLETAMNNDLPYTVKSEMKENE